MIEWQFYWPEWYKFYPIFIRFDDVKFEPDSSVRRRQWVFQFGPLQIRKIWFEEFPK